MTSEKLSDLHTALIDAREGYSKAIEKTRDPDALRFFRLVDSLHADAHMDVHRILASRGEPIDEDGSLMGTVHKAVVAVRSAVVGIDEGSLGTFASGEENNLKAYDKAIGEEPDEANMQALTKHREELAKAVAEMKVVAART